MNIKERFRQINAVHMIVAQAEKDIRSLTGLKMKLITVDALEDDEPEGDYIGMLKVIASALGKQFSDCTVRTRKPAYVRLRKIATHFLLQYFDNELTLEAIALLFGLGKDHHTVIHYRECMKQELANPQDLLLLQDYETALNAVTQWLAD